MARALPAAAPAALLYRRARDVLGKLVAKYALLLARALRAAERLARLHLLQAARVGHAPLARRRNARLVRLRHAQQLLLGARHTEPLALLRALAALQRQVRLVPQPLLVEAAAQRPRVRAQLAQPQRHAHLDVP